MHSIVLAATSDCFHTIIHNHAVQHHLDFVGSETLEKIIRFCYTGQVDLTPENIERIVNVAHELKMHQLKSVCSQFLEATSNSKNRLHYALIAERYGLNSSKELAQQFLGDNCERICKADELHDWKSMNIDIVIENLCQNQYKTFDLLMNSLDSGSGDSNSLLVHLYQAIYRSFVGFF